jgi:signal transduction histidine kinase
VLARRSAIPVSFDVVLDRRLPEVVELAAYYVVAEALTNAAKHANASVVDVQVSASDDVLHVDVRDDGRGGADLTRGSVWSVSWIASRPLGGSIAIKSPPGTGTSLEITLPLAPAEARPPFVSR